jgi:hypothetical protein
MPEYEPSKMMEGDLEVNNLTYKQPTSLSLATNRKMCRQFFQRNYYEQSSTAICEWNTGSSYVNPHNSYLTFKVKSIGDSAVLGSGSALNFIQSLTIRSRSGTELDRIEHLNLWAKNHVPWSFSNDWINHFGSMAGLTNTVSPNLDGTVITTTEQRFVIPLNLLSGFFTPTSDTLIPPHLASGLHCTFEFASSNSALWANLGTTVTGYEISDISIQTDCTDLSDSTQKTLNMEAAESGLEYTYPRVYSTSQSFSTSDINVQIRKAVSQAMTAVAIIRPIANKQNSFVDSLRSAPWDVSRWQYRLGSLYFPNQELKGAEDGLESFFIANSVFDKCKNTRFYCDNSINMAEFRDRFGVMAVSLERDQELNLSGLPINNSRTLELSGTLANAPAESMECIVFLTYMSVAKSFIDNVAVSL